MWHGPLGTGKNTTGMRTPVLPVVVVAALLVARPAPAETSATAPAGGGLPALSVRVDLATATVKAGGLPLPIALDRSQLPAESDVVVEAIPVGAGRRVVHVRVPAKDAEGVAWEAVLAAGQKDPLFAGLTGLSGGDPGERTVPVR